MIFDDLIHHAHHDQEQQPVMPRLRQPATVGGHLHAIADALDGNPLASRLVASGYGRTLTEAEAGHILAIVASIEQVRGQNTAMPDMTSQPQASPSFTAHDAAGQYPQPASDHGTAFPPSGQQG